MSRNLLYRTIPVEILSARALVPSVPIIDFAIKTVVIPKMPDPCGEHCLVFFMTEFPDRDLLAVGSLQLFAGVDESFSVLRCSWHPKYFPSKIGQRSLLAHSFHPLDCSINIEIPSPISQIT